MALAQAGPAVGQTEAEVQLLELERSMIDSFGALERDYRGYDTTIAVYNLDSTKKVDPSLFKIDFTKYPTSPG